MFDTLDKPLNIMVSQNTAILACNTAFKISTANQQVLQVLQIKSELGRRAAKLLNSRNPIPPKGITDF